MLVREVPKPRTSFLCRVCGNVQTQWMGKCPDCGTWDALEKFTEPKPLKAGVTAHAAESIAISAAGWSAPDPDTAVTAQTAVAVPLPEVERADVDRVSTSITELDRVLGGGLVPGSVILLGGEPGIGKSTLLLQAAAALATARQPILYITSEESAYQTRLRAERLFDGLAGADDLQRLFILADTSLPRIIEQARQVKPAALILDSIQMIYKPDLDAAPGSVSQVRRCCTELIYLAKLTNTAIILVGHVTKDGQLAGPKLLEHLVDVVLAFEGDRQHAHRVVRGIKNRYGTTAEVGLFEMTGRGLAEIADHAVTSPEDEPRPGAVICPAMHGSRCLLIEVQALTAPGFLGSAKRRATGLDTNRLAMLIAVLEKHAGLRLADQDIFTSTVGGLKITEPAADLAICLAIAGAHYGRRLDPAVAVFGEVGLGGELRPVANLDQRIAEATRRGFKTVIVPRVTMHLPPAAHTVSTISEAVNLLG